MKKVFFLFFTLLVFASNAQILTSSPYSRYGIGEINLQTFATSAGMGGSFIAYHQDSIAPFFINIANPASLAGIRLTTFELGGQLQFTKISSSSISTQKRNLNFSYGSVGFPLKKIGGAAFGIMPYSTVGYTIKSTESVTNVGDMNYTFNGEGGINKVFLGIGIAPFKNQFRKFTYSAFHDSLIAQNRTKAYKYHKLTKQLVSNLSVGATGNYLFGAINQTTKVIYPGSSTYYNVKRQRNLQVSDFTFNTGLQTHFTIDSIKHKVTDSLKTVKRISLKEKIDIGFGFFANLESSVSATQNNVVYNYALNELGNETIKDTVLNSQNNKGTIVLPLEMGFGLSVKKGERLTWLTDVATTNWSSFNYFGTTNSVYKNSYRISSGINYVQNKLAYGASNYLKRVQYRLGVSYSDGYLDLKNTFISNYAVTAGVGLPVGIGRFDDIAVVNISAQYGKLGSLSNKLIQEEYVRLILGFTFNKRWFIKYKYD